MFRALYFILLFISVKCRDICDPATVDMCCETYEDEREEEVMNGYAKNLTSLMDTEEGCRWFFESESLKCCFSSTAELCEEINDEKCRKENQDYQVHAYHTISKCTLQLYKVAEKDAGNYTAGTKYDNVDLTIMLTVTRNTDLDVPLSVMVWTVCGVIILLIVAWCIYSIYSKGKKRKEKEEKEIIMKEKEIIKKTEEGKALLSILCNENEDAFKIQSKNVDVLAAKDKDGNSILHLFGMPYWTERMTELILEYCDGARLFPKPQDEEQGQLLQFTDKLTQIVNLLPMENIVNAKNKIGETPLHIAAKYGKNIVVKALFKVKNINVNAVDTKMWSPLHHAAYKGHTEVILSLLDNTDIEKDPKADDSKTPLLCAGSAGQNEAFDVLLKYGAELAATTELQQNILHLLCDRTTVHENEGKLEILKRLMSTGDIGEKLKTLLKSISFQENQNTVKSISSDVDSAVGTPLQVAVQTGFFDAAKLLIENGANFRMKGPQNKNQHLLLHAVLKGNKEFADFLATKDSSLVNVRTETDETYLHVAVEKLNLNAVILLLNLDVNKDAISYGKTALQLAEEKHQKSQSDDKLARHTTILSSIIKILKKERIQINEDDLLEKISKSEEDLKAKEILKKSIEEKAQDETKYITKEIKQLTKNIRTMRKQLKGHMKEELEKEKIVEEEKKRENPSMEKIRKTVQEMIAKNETLTTGQMAQVLKMLNDKGSFRHNSDSTSNRFLKPNVERASLHIVSD
jgi:ankyrin repeat protein